MDSWQDGDWFLGGINTSEDMGSLKDAWESLVNLFRRQVVQMEVAVVFVFSNTTSFNDLHCHGTRDDITRSQILGSWCIPLHESLTLRVSQNTTFTSAALCHEAASAIDTCWMELDELGILNGNASSGSHTTTVSSASMG